MALIILYCPIFSEADSGPYQLISEFSRDSMANGQSTGIFVDHNFKIYVTEPSLHLVQVFDQSGNLLRNLNLGPAAQPVDVAVRIDGVVYITDMLNGRVKVASGVPPTVISFNLDMPCGLDIDSHLNLVVRDKTEVLKLLFHTNYTSSAVITQVDAQTNGIESCPIEEANQSTYYTRNHEIEKSTLPFTAELPPNQRTIFDIAADRLGNVFVMTAPWEIKKMDSNGTFITGFDFEEDFFSDPTGVFFNSKIATDSEDNVYVLDSTHGKVLKFKQGGLGPAQFSSPWGVTLDSLGNVYVIDTGNSRIQKFTNTGDFITRWGHLGMFDGRFDRPTGVAIDSSGNVFVADTNNHRIQKFTDNGFFVTKWGSSCSLSSGNGCVDLDGTGPFSIGDGQFGQVSGIAVDASGNVFVADNFNNRIQKFTNTGTFITKWGSAGVGNRQFNSPEGVAVDSSGNVFVVDSSNRRIQTFTNTGEFITKWGSQGAGNGQFSFPRAIALDSSGNVFVTDSFKHNIQKFTNTGTFITKWGSEGSGDGQFSNPVSVVADSSGNVFVADLINDRIQKFTNTGTFITKWGSQGNL
jgi:DNA-binding beta-propeller fold protein YncE